MRVHRAHQGKPAHAGCALGKPGRPDEYVHPLLRSVLNLIYSAKGYQTACAAPPLNVTVPAEFVTLQLPSDWDGPFGQGLTTFTTAVYLAAALIIGGGAITVVNTM